MSNSRSLPSPAELAAQLLRFHNQKNDAIAEGDYAAAAKLRDAEKTIIAVIQQLATPPASIPAEATTPEVVTSVPASASLATNKSPLYAADLQQEVDLVLAQSAFWLPEALIELRKVD